MMTSLIFTLSAVLLVAPLFPAGPPDTPHGAVKLLVGGQYQEAARLLETLLRDADVNHVSTEMKAALYTNLGTAYHKLGRNSDAEKVLSKSVRLWIELGWTSRLEYGISLNNLGDALLAEKFYGKSEGMFQDALAVFRALPEPPKQEIAVALNNLAMIAQSARRWREAEDYYRNAVETLRGPSGSSTGQFAGILNNLGFLYKEQKRFAEARDLYSQALTIWQTNLPPTHPDIAFALHNLGVLEMELNQLGEAEAHLQQALELSASLPPEHPMFSAIYDAYAALMKKTGRKQEAKQLEASARASRTRHNQANYGNTVVDVRTLLR